VHGERKRGKAGGGREMISRESLRDGFVLSERKGRWTEERWMVEMVKEAGIRIQSSLKDCAFSPLSSP